MTRNALVRLLVTHAVAGILPVAMAPSAIAQDADFEISPSFDDEDDDFQVTPSFDDEDQETGDSPDDEDDENDDFQLAPSFDDDEDDFAVTPSFDDEDENDFELTPSFDDEDDDFAVTPSFDDEDDDFAVTPSFDDDEDDFELTPSFDDEDDDFAVTPSFDDDEDDFDLTPSFDDEVVPTDTEASPALDDDDDVEIAPDVDVEEQQALQEGDEGWEDSDEYWEQYWEDLETVEAVEEVAAPEEVDVGLGRVTAVVIDDEFEDPLGGVSVTVDELPDAFVTTGPSGSFYFDLEPGFYILRFAHTAFRPSGYEVEIAPGDVTDMAFVRMISNAEDDFTLVVEGRQDRGSVSAQLREREDATSVSDAISAEQFASAPDSSASGVVRRVVGATTVDDRFLVIRGLSGRYTNGTINGVPIPRTDPTFPGVEFDLFPTDLLASLVIYKSFSPELNGAFAGGLLDLRTETYPEEFELSASISIGSDTSTLGADVLTIPGGSFDFLGFDDGSRGLPSSVPRDTELRSSNSVFGGDTLSQDEVDSIARDFTANWEPTTTTGLPSIGVGFSVGDTLQLGERSLGYLALLDYSFGASRRTGTLRSVNIGSGGRPEVTESPSTETGTFETLWGALGTVTAELAPGHDLTLLSMWNQSAQDRVRIVAGVFDEQARQGEKTTLSFINRSFTMHQLLGSHRRLLPEWSDWHETSVSWTLAASYADRNEPDTRYNQRFETDGALRWRQDPGSGERFFSDLGQRDLTAAIEVDLPRLDTFALSAGGMITDSARTWEARRFRFTRLSEDATVYALDPNDLFSPERVGVDVRLSEETQASDAYDAGQLSMAGFASFDAQLIPALRLTGGARYEVFRQQIESGVGVDDSASEARSRLDQDVLGAGSLVLAPADGMQVRLGYGGTVARPLVEEAAPFVVQDYVRRRTISGNPDLERTYVHNADLRWEWFVSSDEILAASVFSKWFVSPIEFVSEDARGNNWTYLNTDGAQSYGFEFEASLNLGRISSSLSSLALGANLMLANSSVSLACTPVDGAEGCAENYTNFDRPMAGQAPFVTNVNLGWDPDDTPISVDVFYNVVGPYITGVGLNGRGDEVRLPFHDVDITARLQLSEQFRMKIGVGNIAFQRSRYEVDGVITEEQDTPMSFSIGIGYER